MRPANASWEREVRRACSCAESTSARPRPLFGWHALSLRRACYEQRRADPIPCRARRPPYYGLRTSPAERQGGGMATGKLALVVGGGPAPGINGVISSVTIEAINHGLDVIGFRDGFKYLVQGNAEQIRPLRIADVSRLHLHGGSILGTS